MEFAEALRRTAVRPTIAGYEPQPHQQEFHASRNTGRLFIGGNRSGKTVGGAADLVMNMTGKHIYRPLHEVPLRCRAIGVDFDNGVDRIILPEVARWIPPSMLQNGSWEDSYGKGTRTLTLSNGSFCEFMSYDQDTEKFAGTSRHLIWFDEEPPKSIFDENMMRLIDASGHWMCTMTPIEEMTWTYDGLYLPAKEKTNPNIDVFEVETSQNKYINAAEMDILTQGLSKEDKEARVKGKYIRHTGAIYSDYIDTEVNYLKHDPVYSKAWEGMKKNWRHFRMMDHGFRNPTAFLFGCIDTEGKVIIYDEYYASGKLVKENADAVLRQTEDLGISNNIYYTVGDPSIQNTDPITGTSVLAEYAQQGIGIVLGNNDVHYGILRVASRFQQRMLYIGPRCTRLKWELNRYRWDKYLNKKVAERANFKEQPLKKDDHACDALRYGIVSTPPLVNEVDSPVGNVLNVNTAIMGADRYADLVVKQPEYLDVHLGADY
jgi:phage terminase large subunit-like protein